MSRLRLIRHGEAIGRPGEERDPGLSELGEAQAAALAAALGGDPPVPVFSSPMARTRQTAAPLAAGWGVAVAIAPVIRELASPASDREAHLAWLRRALAGRWDELHEEGRRWRDAIVHAAGTVTADQVWVTHFVVINAVVAAAMGSESVTTFRPANCSITDIEVHKGELAVVGLGTDAVSDVGPGP